MLALLATPLSKQSSNRCLRAGMNSRKNNNRVFYGCNDENNDDVCAWKEERTGTYTFNIFET